MRYYRVKPEYDCKHDYFTGYTTIKNELLTPRERNRKFRYLTDDVFETVNVSRKKIYWAFGARFALDKGYRD